MELQDKGNIPTSGIGQELSFQENKYFTPSTEDIRLGYEFEQSSEGRPGYPEWLSDCKVEDEMDFEHILNGDWVIRVPYLTKEQIEKEGWEQRGADNFFYKGQYQVVNNPIPNSRTVKIITNCTYTTWRCLYEGECKDINTFRYICKLLGI